MMMGNVCMGRGHWEFRMRNAGKDGGSFKDDFTARNKEMLKETRAMRPSSRCTARSENEGGKQLLSVPRDPILSLTWSPSSPPLLHNWQASWCSEPSSCFVQP